MIAESDDSEFRLLGLELINGDGLPWGDRSGDTKFEDSLGEIEPKFRVSMAWNATLGLEPSLPPPPREPRGEKNSSSSSCSSSSSSFVVGEPDRVMRRFCWGSGSNGGSGRISGDPSFEPPSPPARKFIGSSDELEAAAAEARPSDVEASVGCNLSDHGPFPVPEDFRCGR